MKPNEDGTYTVALLKVDTPERSGSIYPKHIVQDAVDKLQDTGRSALYGEIECPSYERILRQTEANLPASKRALARPHAMEQFQHRSMVIDETCISHSVDIGTLRIEDGQLWGDVRPAGPHQTIIAQELQNGTAAFAFRGYVSYLESDSIPKTKNPVVSHIAFVSFDFLHIPTSL